MYLARDPVTQEEWHFRTLTGLTKRLGGTTYQVEHSEMFRPPHRSVMILRPAPTGGLNVVRTVVVDREAVAALDPYSPPGA